MSAPFDPEFRMFKRKFSLPILAAASVGLTGVTTALGAAGVVFDLRVHDTGSKDVVIDSPGDSVLLDVYAKVTGYDANPGNDGLSFAVASFRSGFGGLLGDLIGIGPPPGFNAISSTPGSTMDLDGDGDLDVGGTDPMNAAGYYGSFSGVGQWVPTPTPDGVLVAQARFTAFSLSANTTTVAYTIRSDPQQQLGPTVYFDGTQVSLHSTDPRIGYGGPITIHAAEVSGGGTTEFLSGTIDDHLTIDHTIKPGAGSTLILNRGLSVLPGGVFDARDAVGNYGNHEIRINDTTSGNAGGAIFVGTMTIGAATPGRFDQTRGLTKVGTQLVLGATGGAPGTLTVSGGSVLATKATIGQAADGLVTQSGGQVTIGTLAMGTSAASGVGSRYELSGDGALTVSSRTDLGGGASAALFRQTGGQSSFNGTLWVAAQGANAGAIELTGGRLGGNQVRVTAGASVDHTGGTFSASLLALGQQTAGSSAPAIYNFHNGTLEMGSAFVGDRGNGGIVQSDGLAHASGIVHLFDRYDLSAGTLNTWGLVVNAPADNLAGLFNQSGGVVSADYLDVYGTYRITGGTFSVNKQLRILDGGTIDFGSNPSTMMAGPNSLIAVPSSGLANTSNASLVGAEGSLINYPAGYVPADHFAHVSTQGLLHEDYTPLHIPAGRSVTGAGIIHGDVTNDGALNPGYAGGVMDIDGSFTQSADGIMTFEIGGSAFDQTKFDALHVTGATTLAGLLDVHLLDGYLPSPDDAYTILSGANISSTFANAQSSIAFDGGRFDVTYGGDYVLLSNFQVVPEPTLTGTFALAAIATLSRRRRRARA